MGRCARGRTDPWRAQGNRHELRRYIPVAGHAPAAEFGMALGQLIGEWTARLLGVRTLLRTKAPENDGWLLRIRERVLTFLVARYGTRQDVLRAEPWVPGAAEDDTIRFPHYLPPPEPEVADAPPRRRLELAKPLRTIQQLNEDKRPRWRLWL